MTTDDVVEVVNLINKKVLINFPHYIPNFRTECNGQWLHITLKHTHPLSFQSVALSHDLGLSFAGLAHSAIASLIVYKIRELLNK